MLLLSVALFCACEQDNVGETSLMSLSFSASMEAGDGTKTMMAYPSVLWESGDKVSLFSGDGLAVRTELAVRDDGKLSEGGTAYFEGLGVAPSKEYLAVYPHNELNAFDGMTVTLSIPSEQVAVAGGFASGANASVAWTEGKHLVFRNVGGLLGFRFNTLEDAANTKKVTLKSKKADGTYQGLSGNLAVSLEGESKVPVVTGCSADFVSLLAPEGGFKDMTTYYAVIPPGRYEGFEIKFVDKEDEEFDFLDEDIFYVSRSGMVHMDVVKDPYLVQTPPPDVPELDPSLLPDEFILSLDFTGSKWPFTTPVATTQTKAGETYDFVQEFEDVTAAFTFAFATPDASKPYSTHKNGLTFPVTSGMIKLPAVETCYLTKVVVKTTNDAQVSLQTKFDHSNAGSYNTSGWTTSAVFELPVGNVSAQVNKSYTLRMRQKDKYIKSIELTYSKTDPTQVVE